jgi:hypothetical protein
MSDTHANYLLDLGYYVREAAEEAKKRINSATEDELAFQQGRLMAYYEVVSLMQQQAVAFGLPLADLRLTGSTQTKICSETRPLGCASVQEDTPSVIVRRGLIVHSPVGSQDG